MEHPQQCAATKVCPEAAQKFSLTLAALVVPPGPSQVEHAEGLQPMVAVLGNRKLTMGTEVPQWQDSGPDPTLDKHQQVKAAVKKAALP